MMWNFDKIAEDEKIIILNLFRANKLVELLGLYKEKGVIPRLACDACDINEQVKQWTKWALIEKWKLITLSDLI